MSSRTGCTALEKGLPSLMSKSRLLHSKATAAVSLSLVHQFGEQDDRDLCYQAGLLHDIAREWKDEDLILYAEKNLLVLEEEERDDPVLLHAPVGAHLLMKRGYSASLCLAVRYHTLGSVGMGRLGLVLYIADYIEPGRTHITDAARKALRDLPSLELICLEILKDQEPYLKKKGKEPARCSRELMHYLLSGKSL